MKLSRKDFKIVQLVENRDDYKVVEILWIFGIIPLTECYWCLDGMNGDIPYHRLNSAKEKIKELEKQEKTDSVKRDGGIIFFISVLIAVAVLLTWILNN